jgi:hypothetical protein
LKKIALIDPLGGKAGMNFFYYSLAIGLASNSCEVFYFTYNQINEIKANNGNTIFSFYNICAKNFY